MHKVQTVTVLVCVALSACMCLAFGLVYGGVTRGVEVSAQRNGAEVMVIPADAANRIGSTELLYAASPAPIYMDASLAEEVASLDGVERATAQFFSQTLNSACCSASVETRLIGVDFATDFVVTPLLDAPVDGLADDEVIVGSGVDGITDGTMRILGETYRVAGVMAQTGAEMDYAVVMSIDHARALAAATEGLGSYWSKYGDPSGLVSCVMVDATDDEEAYERLLIKLNLTQGTAYVEHSATAERAQEQLQSVFGLLLGAAAMMVVVALLQLFARFYSCVWDRKGELALYRAIGADAGALRRLIGGEVAVIVAAGLVCGVVLGLVVEQALLTSLQGSMAFPFVGLGVGGGALLVCGIVVLYALIAALAVSWPLRQIGRLDPSLAMQQGDID